jgi:hypothetical protein
MTAIGSAFEVQALRWAMTVSSPEAVNEAGENQAAYTVANVRTIH